MNNSPAKNLDQDLLDQLCIQIESIWETERDDTIVDRLASEYPEYAEALYEFFSVLIEIELNPVPQDEHFTKSVNRVRDWLKQDGYQQVSRIASEQHFGATSTTFELSDNHTKKSAEQAPQKEEKTKEILGPMSLLQLLYKRTGKERNNIAETMSIPYAFLLQVDRYPQNVPEGARKEIACRAERLGVNREEALHSLEHPFQDAMAASRNTPYPKDIPSYAQIVSQARMKAKDKKYWLSFINFIKEGDG